MPTERKAMRYAHAEGHTDVCFNEDGTKLFTCGSDGDVRIWDSIEDDDPKSECAGELALAVAFRNNRYFVGTDSNNVQAYSFPECKRDGIICRFTAPVTDIVVSEDGFNLAACSCDMEMQHVNLKNNNITKLTGHTAPVLSVSLDPQNKYLASSSCDGTVKVWDTKSSVLIKTFTTVVPTSNDFFRATHLGRSSWLPETGALLAVPQDKNIYMYERDNWTMSYLLFGSSLVESLSISAFSTCGNFICGSSIKGEIHVWDIDSRSSVSYTQHDKNVSITSLAWHPSKNEIAFCDALGQLGTVTQPRPEEGDVVERTAVDVSTPRVDDVAGYMDQDDDDDNAISLEKIKASTTWPGDEDSKSSHDDDLQSVVSKKVLQLIELQPAFQPTSTLSHFQHRFLLWNDIGIVRCFNTEDEKSIDVEFHDTTFHHGLHKNNYEEYIMADLSLKLFCMACRSTEDTPGKLTCIMLNSWDGSKEWSVPLPREEGPVAVAASGDWVALATDTYNIRIFSYAGTQRPVITSPGPVVCMSGHDTRFIVVCHAGLGIADCQNLCFAVFNVTPFNVETKISWQPVAMCPKSTLKWVGFTDEGAPCCYDSEGVLRMFPLHYPSQWTIVCDTKLHTKGKSDHYFVLGVSEKYQNVRSVLCKGSYYPLTAPTPNVVEIPLKLPLCEVDSEKTINEELFWRNLLCLPSIETMSNNNPDCRSILLDIEKNLKQSVIKLFANACRSDADMRATEVATLMSDQPLQIAVKYASKCGKMYLSEKLSKIKPIDWNMLHDNNTADNVVANTSRYQHEEYNRLGLNHSQQDMFEEQSVPSTSVSLFASSGGASSSDGPRKTQDTSVSDLTVTTPRPRNPFKVTAKKDDGPKGLNFLNNYKPNVENKTIKTVELKKGSKQTTIDGKNVDVTAAKKKPNFIQWFSTNKSSLQEEHPELSVSELTKLGMKKFREENSKLNEKENTIVDNKKRKLEETDVDNDVNDETSQSSKKSLVDKLSCFRNDSEC